jgi:hypothetical protein
MNCISLPVMNRPVMMYLNQSIKQIQKKSNGGDDIHPKIVRDAAHNVTEPLEYIYNLSFNSDFLPNQLKEAQVILVYNKEVSLATNY